MGERDTAAGRPIRVARLSLIPAALGLFALIWLWNPSPGDGAPPVEVLATTGSNPIITAPVTTAPVVLLATGPTSIPTTKPTVTSTTVTSTTVTSTTATSTTTQTTQTTAPPTSQPEEDRLHVRPTGQPGDGTAERPFGTLEAGLRAVGPGQTLIVHGGEYRERISLGSGLTPGRAEAPVMVMAAPGERPVVRGILRLRRLQHWVIDGINVTWDAERNSANEHMVSFNDGSDWIYRNSEVWGARSYAGVLVGGDPVNWALRGLHVHDTHQSNNTNQDHLIYCNCGSGGGVIERNLLVGSENGRAIKVGTVHDHNSDIANVTIRYNTMVDNTGPSNVQLSYRASNVTVERNIFVGSKPGRANVTAYRLAGSGNVVRDNIGWRSTEVVQTDPGIVDGGGNRHLDPELGPDFRPRRQEASAYGHLAS